MKDKIIAVLILIVAILAVVANGIVLDSKIECTLDELKSLNISKSDTKHMAERIFDDFLDKERYISLTVSHEDLTSIEESFCDMIGYLKVGDTDSAEVAKGRLIHSLEHLRRLSGFNLDSII